MEDLMSKKVCVIHTGGTIGMLDTKFGYKPKKGFIKKVLTEIKKLNLSDMPDFDVLEHDVLLDSTNMSVNEWNMIAENIVDSYDRYDGFVILHGTDTMAYTASALSFMLEGLSKPVILTGSQIPLYLIRNDARDNLITSLLITSNYNVPEVTLFFNNKLYRGNRAKKISSDDLSAFDSPNFPPLGVAGVNIVLNENLIRNPGEELRLVKFNKNKIAVLKIFPGIQYELFESIITPDLKGLVIEAYGTGNIPDDSDGKLAKALRKLEENGTVIVVCTQCYKGSAIVGQYASSKELINAGAVSGYDMTVEAAVTKLYYLFSMDYDQDTIKRMMGTDLRGELGLS
ncbi:MAG: asparaginase [Clostridiales bacterium]|nr:asparaginase [Clostridiales bacterium]